MKIIALFNNNYKRKQIFMFIIGFVFALISILVMIDNPLKTDKNF